MKSIIITASCLFMTFGTLYGQTGTICEDTTYSAFYLKANTLPPKFNCDAYVISKNAFDRFQFLNNAYKDLILDFTAYDSLFNLASGGFIANTDNLVSIYKAQKQEIDKMTTRVIPGLDSSINKLILAEDSLNKATMQLDSAVTSIKKSKREKWIYAAAGILIGGLLVAAVSD